MLTNDQAFSIARITVKRALRSVSHLRERHIIEPNDLFNSCFIAAKESKSIGAAFRAAKYCAWHVLSPRVRRKKLPFPNDMFPCYEEIKKFMDTEGYHLEHCFAQKHLIKTIDVIAALTTISEADLILLKLRIIDGLTCKQTASVLGTHYGAVRWREGVLKTKLSKLLKDWKGS